MHNILTRIVIALFAATFFITTSTANAIDNNQAALLRKGKASLERSDYNSALASYLKYIQTEEKRTPKDTANLLDTYYNIGGIYSVYQDFAQALDIYESGYQLSSAANNADMQFKFLNNMIGASCNIGKTAEARKLNAKVKQLKGVEHGLLMFYYYFNNGFIAGCEKHDNEKAQWMNKAIAAVSRYGLPQKFLVYPYSEVYLCYERQGQLDKALAALLKYDSLAHVINNNQSKNVGKDKDADYQGQAYLFADCYKGLMRIYTKMGNKEKALYYQNEFFRYNDSLLNVNEFSKIRNQHLNYENQQTQLIIDSQRKTILYQTICLIMLAVLVVTAVAAIIIIKRQRKVLYDTNIALFDRNNELVEAEQNTLPQRVDTSTDTGSSTASTTVSEQLRHAIADAMKDSSNFCNPDFSLSMLAQAVDSNTTYVSQAINTSYNKNFRTILNEYRVKEAMKRMKDIATYGNYSIQGISESVGFKSASNFIAAFKKTTGMTPSLYQKLSKNE